MEERCIANDVAYASLHNQHLGKQRIKHSTGRARKTRAKCYIHTLAYWRRASGGGQENMHGPSSSASPFEHESGGTLQKSSHRCKLV